MAFFQGLRGVGEEEGGGKERERERGGLVQLTFSLNSLGVAGSEELAKWFEGVGDGFRVLNLDSCQIDTAQVFILSKDRREKERIFSKNF